MVSLVKAPVPWNPVDNPRHPELIPVRKGAATLALRQIRGTAAKCRACVAKAVGAGADGPGVISWHCGCQCIITQSRAAAGDA